MLFVGLAIYLRPTLSMTATDEPSNTVSNSSNYAQLQRLYIDAKTR